MEEMTLNGKEDGKSVRTSKKAESQSVVPSKVSTPAPTNFAKKTGGSCSSVISWADPNELAQMLDFFTTPPTRVKELPASVPVMARTTEMADDTFRGWSFDCDRSLDQRRAGVGHCPMSTVSPRSRAPSSNVPVQSHIPPKAQRLMGIDSPLYLRSTFDEWEDREELQSSTGSAPSRKPKIDSRTFFRSPPKAKSQSQSPEAQSLSRLQQCPIEERVVDSPTQSVPRESPISKWTTLSQRFRSSSTSPVAVRLKRTNSSPTSPSFFFDKLLDRESCATKAPSPVRITSMIETPTAIRFPSDLLSAPSMMVKGSTHERSRLEGEGVEWAEARASSRALNHATIGGSTKSSTLPSNSKQKPKLEGAQAGLPVQVIRSTPPLRFNPHRRPRAPFPPAEQPDHEGVESAKRDSLPSPTLPPCPNKMKLPSRMMRPVPFTPPKDQPPPIRPRRPTESDIFASTSRSKAKPAKPAMPSPLKASAAPPPRRPPPNIPIPPVPAKLALIQVVSAEDSSEKDNRPDRDEGQWSKEADGSGGKTKGLMVALGMRTPSPLPNPTRSAVSAAGVVEKSVQASASSSPQRIVFSGDGVLEPFCAEMSNVQHDQATTGDVRVELVVGGVQLQTSLSLLVGSGAADVVDDGMAAWLQREIKAEDCSLAAGRTAHFPSSSFAVPIHSNVSRGRVSNATVGSLDDVSFASTMLETSSSEDDETDDEEHHQPSFAYQMSPLPPMHWSGQGEGVGGRVRGGGEKEEEEKVPSPINTLQLDSTLRHRAHARTPTSVSVDEEINESEEEGSGGMSRRIDATPDLVTSSSQHAFIFTTSLPRHHCSEPIAKSIVSVQVSLSRDPQPYPSILHLLKHGSLPDYFTMNGIPREDRLRALHLLSSESNWLGYRHLVQVCNQFEGQLQ